MAIFAFLIDPADSLYVKSDTSIAFMQVAQSRGYEVAFFTLPELFYENGKVLAQVHFVDVDAARTPWYKILKTETICLFDCAAICIRLNPPFDNNYLYVTYLLDLVESRGVIVTNSAAGIRDANEKIFATHFASFTPSTLINSDNARILDFLAQHGRIVLKPLNVMGGQDIVLVDHTDLDRKAVVNMMTQNQTRIILAQKFLAEVAQGDKRIFLINGEPLDYIWLRKPPADSFLANTAAGGTGTAIPFDEKDRALCDALKPALRKHGLHFVGIDVIHGLLTEVNVTSPTGIRYIARDQPDYPIAQLWMNFIDSLIKNR